MADAVFLGGDRYHKAEEAHAGIGPVLENAGLKVHYTSDFASLDADLFEGAKLLVILRDGMEWPNGHDADPRDGIALRDVGTIEVEAIDDAELVLADSL